MTVVFITFLATVAFFGFFDLPADFKARNWKVPAVYLCIMLAATALCLAVMRGVNLKSPSDIVASVVKALFPSLK